MKTNSVHYTMLGIPTQPREADVEGFLYYREGYESLLEKTDAEMLIHDRIRQIEAWRDCDLGKQDPGPRESLPDTIASPWHYTDVQSQRPGLTDDQAREVLQRAKNNHDPSVGINWEVIEFHADALISEATEWVVEREKGHTDEIWSSRKEGDESKNATPTSPE